MNQDVTIVLAAATDPAAAGGDEAVAMRERLARAGLLAAPAFEPVERPDPRRVAAAGRRAGRGTPLAELVSAGR